MRSPGGRSTSEAGGEPRPRPRWRRIALLVTGWAFLVLGVLGLFLPVLQGILFLLIGAALLSRESPFFARQLERLRARYPKLAKKMDEADARAQSIWARIVRRFNGR